ncbi:MAG: hypothetical protein V4662_13615 [Verrucomicrobiota bacterium]
MTPEDLRLETRTYLYARPLASLNADEIAHGLGRKGYRVTREQVVEALHFLEGLQPTQVMRHRNPLGGNSPNWQITSAGSLAHERNE